MNNDEKMKKMIESVEIPIELKPENIKKMLDDESYSQRCSRSPSYNKRYIRIMAGLTACAVCSTVGIVCIKHKNTIIDTFTNVSKMKNTDDFSASESSLASASVSDYSMVYSLLGISDETDGAGAMVLGESTVPMMQNSVSDDSMAVNESAIEITESKEYSVTYNQEKDVEESDKALTDGENIFYIADSQYINIATVENGNFQQTYSIDMKESVQFQSDNYTIQLEDMYLTDDKNLVVISSLYDKISDVDFQKEKFAYISDSYTCVTLFDVKNFEETGEPVFMGGYTQDGKFSDVRMIGDYMYLISDYTTKTYDEIEGEYDYSSYIPSYTESNNNSEESCLVDANDIILPENPNTNLYSINYKMICGLKVDNTVEYIDSKSLVQYSGDIYCITDNMYAVYGYEDTEIIRLEISEGTITEKASAEVKGRVLNQFSMSEYNGYFRIATTATYKVFGNYVTSGTLYIMDTDLNVVSVKEQIGVGEEVKSVNFDGDMAYVVTFEQTDPLFAIDLSDPKNPVILDEYKINGYSTYMQKWSDNLLLGFGADADENGNEMGIKLVMFDVSDANNILESGKVSLSVEDNLTGWVTSIALSDRKALLISPEKNIIGMPYAIASYSENEVSESGGYVFFSYNNEEFTELGRTSRLIDKYGMYTDRALYIGDYIYVLSPKEFISIDINDFSEVDSHVFDNN